MNPNRTIVILALCGALASHATAAVVSVKKGGAHPTVQSGVDAANAGDVVKVNAGIFQENVVVPAGKNGLTIAGIGAVLIEARPAGGAGGGPGIVVLSANVTVRDLAIRNAAQLDATHDGFGIDVAASGFTAVGLAIEGCSRSAIRVDGDGLRVRECLLRANRGGLSVVSSSDAQVRDCDVRQIGNDQGISLDQCTDVEVANCRFRSIDGAAVVAFGAGTARITVQGNDVLNCSDGAIFVFGDDSLIANNVTDVTNGGINIRGTGTTIRDNVIRSSLDAGIFVSQATSCRITNNRIREYNQSGITLGDTTSDLDVTDNFITDGRIDSNAGIEVGCSNSRILRNRVVRCGEGFFVSGDNCALRDNVVKSSLQDGFDFATSAAICLLDNDTAIDCAAEGLDNSGSGTTVTNCTFKDCRIDVANNGTFSTFSGNTFVTGGQATPPEID